MIPAVWMYWIKTNAACHKALIKKITLIHNLFISVEGDKKIQEQREKIAGRDI